MKMGTTAPSNLSVKLFCILATTSSSCLSFCALRSTPSVCFLASSKAASTCFLAASKNGLSESERERRDEDERRRKRRDDVIVGKTSANKGEKDFVIDPEVTQQEYLRQASRVEEEVFRLTEAGMGFLKSLQLDKADKSFQRVFELKPDAYLWQAGIVKYYLGEITDAATIFAESAEKYESRFGQPASEERIWRDACELKYLSSLPKERIMEVRDTALITALIPVVKEVEQTDDLFGTETRKVINLVRDLFSSTVVADKSGELLARAKLRSIGGTHQSQKVDRKMWKLSSWFYLGLHYDALGFAEESKKCMKVALKFGPSTGKSDDIVHTLPLLHMSVRDWFDDDDFEAEVVFEGGSSVEEGIFSPVAPNDAVASMAYADPLIEKSIREGVSKMKLKELKDALRLRGKTTTGSKENLQERLFYSLMDDAGFASGFAP